jgi:tetratricopeptide (TPR) repeat protein
MTHVRNLLYGLTFLTVALAPVPQAWAQVDQYFRACVSMSRASPGQVIGYCTTAIRSDLLTQRDLATALHARGAAQGALGRYDLAIPDYSEAIRLAPDFTAAFFSRGYASLNVGAYQNAANDFSAVIARDSQRPDAYDARGFAYAQMGRLDLARQDYDRALQLDPRYIPALLDRGFSYQLDRQFDRAIADYNRVITLDPQYVWAYLRRGAAYDFKGEHDRAMQDYDQAVQISPDFAAAFVSRGDSLQSKGEYDRAIADYDKAARFSPRDPTVYVGRGNAYAAKGQFDHALQDFDEAVRLAPEYVAVFTGRANVYIAHGQLDRAIDDYSHAIALVPNSAKSFTYRGNTYVLKRDFDRAFKDFDEASRLDAQDPEVFMGLGGAHRAQGKYDLAIEDYAQALKLDPRFVPALIARGDTFRFMRRYDLAGEDYEQALRLEPRNALVHNARGLLFASLGRYDSALKEYDEAIRIDPRMATSLVNRGGVFISKRAYDLAIAECTEAIRIDPRYIDAFVARGSARTSKQDYTGAIADYEAALQINPKFAVALYGRGIARKKNHDSIGGETDIAAALAIDPNVVRAFSGWGSWQKRVAEQTAGYDVGFGMDILLIAAGGVIVAVIVAPGWPSLLLATAVISGLAGLLLGTGLPVQSPFADVASLMLVGIFLLVAMGSSLALALALAFLSSDRVDVFGMARLRQWARDVLVPQRWPDVTRTSLSPTDLAKRVFVTVSAATGGVVGSLATMRLFWENLAEVFTPQGVVTALVLTIVSVVLIRPLHEYVMDRGLRSMGVDDDTPARWASLWAGISWRTVVRLSIVFVGLFQLDVMYRSLDLCIQRGPVEATYRVVFGGLAPGIVSFYWSAALQLGATTLRRTAARAALILSAAIWYPRTIDMVRIRLLELISWRGDTIVWALVLIAAMAIGIAASLLCNGIPYGAYAFAGGYAIARGRGAYAMYLLSIALFLVTPIAEALHLLLLIVTGENLQGADYLYLSWREFPATAGWILGLFASSFPQLVRGNDLHHAPAERAALAEP